MLVIMEKRHFSTFDLFKILASFSVVIGHAFIDFFSANYNNTHSIPWRFSGIEVIAVDIFFIISGIFIANSIEKNNSYSPFEVFIAITKKRFVRLYEPSIFVTILYLLESRFIQHSIGIKSFSLYWPALFMLGNINGLPGNNILWYVSSLFWNSIPLTAFLCYKKKISLTVIFPLIFFIEFSYLYNTIGLSVHNYPIISNFLSGGIIKSQIELILGIEIFYSAKFFQEKFAIKHTILTNILISSIEFFCCLGILFSITQNRYDGHYCFLVYPSFLLLSFIFLIQREVIFGFCKKSSKLISSFAKYTFMLYLTHTLLIHPVAQFFDFTEYNIHIVLICTLLITIVFAIIMYYFNIFILQVAHKIWCQLFLIKWRGEKIDNTGYQR